MNEMVSKMTFNYRITVLAVKRIYSATPQDGLFFLVWGSNRSGGRTIFLQGFNYKHISNYIYTYIYTCIYSYENVCNIFQAIFRQDEFNMFAIVNTAL